ncbi:MAG: DUF6080 domain-containing protein [Prevotella sp.]
MKDLFCLRRGEWWLLPLPLVIMVALNLLMVQYNNELFTRGGNLAYYGLFYKHFMLSGYDDLTYITLSNGQMYYAPFRHPLITPLLYPLYLLNHWQMGYTDMNMAIYIVAALLVVCGIYSFIFFHRTMREVMCMCRFDALLLTLLLFSFGHVMVASFAPDHFGVSLFLLTLTLYVAGRCIREKRMMGKWQSCILLVLTGGVTLTNGAKAVLASLFCGGRRLFGLRHLLVAVVIPVTILAGAFLYQYYYVQLPAQEHYRIRVEERMRKDKKFAKEIKSHEEWKKTHAGEKLIDNPFFEWTDKSTSRLRAAIENMFGEAIQLHDRHLLEDTNRTRPNYVPYSHLWQYGIEAVIMALFIAGLWMGRRDRFIQLAIAWFAIDFIIHFILGFAILEVYIMAVHWIFIIPTAFAVLLRNAPPRLVPWLRATTVVLVAYLLTYNGSLVARYMIH